MTTFNYKVCILAAGTGSEMNHFATHINKAILPLNFKAVISYIIEKFPPEIELVIAVGHKKETVVDYLDIAHPERQITYVEIENYVGPGTGPGYSLLQCRQHLACPFIFYTADTIVLEEVPKPDHNWFGIAPVKNTEPYCTVKMKNNLICQLEDKTKNNNKFAFIGLAGVKDYQTFFDSLEENNEAPSGEIQVSNGFQKLVEHNLAPIGFTWFDTGTIDNYRRTNKNFSGENKFDFSKGQGDEFLYFINDRVIKFFQDKTIIDHRYERATKGLAGLTPQIESKRDNFYSYLKIDGQVLYETLNRRTVRDFLDWAETNLWQKKNLSTEEKKIFDQACQNFYVTKTKKRLEAFYKKTGTKDASYKINGVKAQPLEQLLVKIDWNKITAGLAANFHGDLQFDNILVTKQETDPRRKFVLLDWRQDFAGLTDYGDLYYDLAKLYGGTLISYPMIKEGLFTFAMGDEEIYYSYQIKNDLVEAREEFEKFLQKHAYDITKVKLMTALIFLNMSPLHEHPFDHLLYFMGQNMLHNILNEQ